MKIDIHSHILPREIPDFGQKFGYKGFLQLEHLESNRARMLLDDGSLAREVDSRYWDPVVRIRECNKFGIDLQVLSTVPMFFCYWAKPFNALEIARFLNDHLARVITRHPDRFVGLGTIPMQSPELAMLELERCIKKLGLTGIQIGTHVNEWNLDDPHLFPILEMAQDLGAAVFVHPWDMMGMKRMPKYWLPWLVGMPAEVTVAICSMIFGGVFERLPRLRVAFAYGGGTFGATIGRIEQGFKVRPDLCAVDNKVNPTKYLSRFYIDSLVYEPRALRYLLDVFGEHQIALGSDYPFPLGEDRPGYLIESLGDYDKETKDLLLRGTALEWLGKKESDFSK